MNSGPYSELDRVEYISRDLAINFLLPKHYSGRIPNIKWAFGWFIDNKLMAVCTFGIPASHQLCIGICGDKFSSRVIELNRLCRIDNFLAPLSHFISECLRILSKENLIIVSFADTGMGHHGYIYQATNFLYTGCTKERTDKFSGEKKHSRHATHDSQLRFFINDAIKRKIRTAKHRYIYFACRDKKIKKEMKQSLRYPILPYPKGDNRNYKLGDFLQEQIILKGT